MIAVSWHDTLNAYRYWHQLAAEGRLSPRLETRTTLASPHIMPEPAHSLNLQSLPTEILQMIVDHTLRDIQNLISVRTVSKLLRALSNRHFRQSYLMHLHISPTFESFIRLAETTQVPDLASDIQSITVTYDNQNPSVLAALCPGIGAIDEADLLLRALDNLHRIGKRIRLIVRVAKIPLDHKASIISIMYQVLVYILFYHGGHGVQKIFLDFDDTFSRACSAINTLLKTRASTKHYSLAYRRIWAHIMQSQKTPYGMPLQRTPNSLLFLWGMINGVFIQCVKSKSSAISKIFQVRKDKQ
jgi:hypothetical protein